ncbi:hypothetical protein EF847_19435 [Actinobacteria bacterium YIM 96077]|uniref:Uncharacterized protein n=2 Tax=Phytoactinopolyspora halophila TaxID=1981511 RepID=A0A329QP43_9ACTN|nr:hypothetical protein EF847_19435 [Actinobacteria bacterium YIM 96077]RAW14135.1 hypothetical protein DPM12_11700 [Phytoactinopolyspora halophila]
MSTGMKLLIGAGGVLLAWMLLPFWFVLLVLVGLPVAAYLMLDDSQRRRLKGHARRRSIDH